jgi:hypothetical protein
MKPSIRRHSFWRYLVMMLGLVIGMGAPRTGQAQEMTPSDPANTPALTGNLLLLSPGYSAPEAPAKSSPDAKRSAVFELALPQVPRDSRPAWEGPFGLDANFLQKYEDQWGGVSSKTMVHDSRALPDSPLSSSKWQTHDEMRMNVHGPIFLFSQVNAGCDALDNQELKLEGKTGLACKLEGGSRCELLLRGGPTMSCADPLRPERYKQESELLLELQCRCPLPGRVNLEYETAATPALSLAERDRLKQDLRLALPLGNLGKINVGAKHSWENTPAPRPWTDGMQFYIGVDLER